MCKIILREEKFKLLKVLRDIIDKKKSTIMVGARSVPKGDDLFIVCLSPNLMKRVPKLPTEYDGSPVVYQELEPFTKYTHKIDSIF